MKRTLFIIPFLLAGCGDNNPPPPPPLLPITTVTLPVVNFPIYAKVPTTLCLTDPTCQKTGYVTQAVYGKLAGGVTLQYEIVEVGTPVYQYKLNPDNVCEYPANVRLYFQSAAGDRWWSAVNGVLGPGSAALMTALTGGDWSNATGQSGSSLPAQFEAAKSSVAQIGMTFGGGCFAGHGVNISTGQSTFTVKSYSIN